MQLLFWRMGIFLKFLMLLHKSQRRFWVLLFNSFNNPPLCNKVHKWVRNCFPKSSNFSEVWGDNSIRRQLHRLSFTELLRERISFQDLRAWTCYFHKWIPEGWQQMPTKNPKEIVLLHWTDFKIVLIKAGKSMHWLREIVL